MKIYLFYCSSSLDQRDLEREINLSEYKNELKTIPLPCSGKADILYLTKAFEYGADGVAIVTCKQGECHYLEGNLRAKKRVEAIDILLDEIGLGKDRIAVIQMSDGGIGQVIQKIKQFNDRIISLSVEGHTDDIRSPVTSSE